MGAKITDVAALAGVSIATVSHVINGSRPVRKETADRVQRAIRELNYTPNSSARSLKTGNKRMIGFLVPDISNLFFATMIDSIEREIAKKGYHLMVVNTCESGEKEQSVLQSLCTGIIDGVIIASSVGDSQELSDYLPKNFPVVFVDRRLKNNCADLVETVSYRAIYESVEYLLQKGHEKIGCIFGLPHLSTTQNRYDAYFRAVSDHGLSPDKALVRNLSIENSNPVPLCEELIENGCTALFFGNSRTCMQSLCVLNHYPDRYEVVTFLDSPEYRELFRGMHVIEQPTGTMGAMAGEQILKRIVHPDAPTREILLYSVFHEN